MNTSLPLALSVILASSLIGCTELAVETRTERQPLYATGPTYVAPAPAYQPQPTYIAPNPNDSAAPPIYKIEPQQPEVRYERGGRGDLDSSMAQLHNSIAGMNDLLRLYGPDNYRVLKDQLQGLNSQVDAFQNLVNHHERNNVLRSDFNNVEQAAAAIDVHMREMNPSPQVNDAWQKVGAAYHHVSDDINFRSASER